MKAVLQVRIFVFASGWHPEAITVYVSYVAQT